MRLRATIEPSRPPHHGSGTKQRFAEVFSVTCRADPARLALVDGQVRLSFGEWLHRSEALADALARDGVGAGDVVAFQLPNWWEAAVIFTAIGRLGAIANPLLPIFREHELLFMLRQSGARHLFIPTSHRGTDFIELIDAVRRGGVALDRVYPVRGETDVFAELTAGASRPPQAAPEPGLLLLMYTSGTTAAPKGVLHTDATLIAEVESLRRAHALTAADSTLMPSPLTHISGVLHGIMSPAILGTTAVFMERWDPAEAARLIESEMITYMVGAPIFLQDLLAVHSPGDWASSLRLFSCGGASVSPQLMRDARRVLGCNAKRVYGSTEFPTIATSAPDDPTPRAIECEGRPIPPNQIRVADEEGRILGIGEQGEIQARGPECFVGYIDASMNADAFTADGWFRTGDLGEIDADGYLTVTGRIKEIVIRKGEKISIREVEDLLLTHPRIAAVCLVGIADAEVGERLCAAIQPIDGSEPLEASEVAQFLRDHGLAAQKLPERIAFVTSLPHTESGKAHRAAVAALFA